MKSLIYKHLQVNKHVAWIVVDKKFHYSFMHSVIQPLFLSNLKILLQKWNNSKP